MILFFSKNVKRPGVSDGKNFIVEKVGRLVNFAQISGLKFEMRQKRRNTAKNKISKNLIFFEKTLDKSRNLWYTNIVVRRET